MAETEEIMDELQEQAETPAQMLQIVNKAIIATSQAKRYKIGSREVERSDLSSLRALRSELMQEVDQSNSNAMLFGNTSVCEFEGR